VSISGNAVSIGAPLRDAAGADSGAAYVFRFDGLQWVFEQAFFGWNPVAGDRFGTAIAIDQHSLVIGAPGRDLLFNDMGEAFSYQYDGSVWTFHQALQGPAEFPIVSGYFGSAVAVRLPHLVIGAERSNVYSFPYYSGAYTGFSAGSGTLYELSAGSWSERFCLREHYIEVINQSTFMSPVAGHTLGAAAAIGTETVILGAPMNHNVAGGGIGWALLFDIEPSDCDGNGAPDVCETDCNHNLVADVCELLERSVLDCDSNGTPDECDNGFDYVVDDGTAGVILGPGMCPNPGRDFIWLNQFNVEPGGQRITHVAAAWSSYSPEGTPATVLIYDDPNNDGDPTDAVLITTAPAIAHDAFGLNPNLRFTQYEVPSTHVGDIGESFFIGMHMAMPCNVYGAVLDSPSPVQNRSWRILAPFGTANIHDLTANEGISLITTGNWAVRAVALDCDANGVWDQCDIDGDPSLDLNNNGIIDSCDIPCPGDVAGGSAKTFFRDGTVSIDDLLVIINHWNETGPPGTVPGDIAPDGAVDGWVSIDDLLLIVNSWGGCP
jgi:hypothetical protein